MLRIAIHKNVPKLFSECDDNSFTIHIVSGYDSPFLEDRPPQMTGFSFNVTWKEMLTLIKTGQEALAGARGDEGDEVYFVSKSCERGDVLNLGRNGLPIG